MFSKIPWLLNIHSTIVENVKFINFYCSTEQFYSFSSGSKWNNVKRIYSNKLLHCTRLHWFRRCWKYHYGSFHHDSASHHNLDCGFLKRCIHLTEEAQQWCALSSTTPESITTVVRDSDSMSQTSKSVSRTVIHYTIRKDFAPSVVISCAEW